MSGIATGTALAIGLGTAGSIGAAAIGANAASNAASTQANAAEYNAQLQAELGQEQLGYENYQFQQGQANEAPWLQGGANALAQLEYEMGLGGAPTGSPAGGTMGSAPGGAPSVPTGNPVEGRMGSAATGGPGGPLGMGLPNSSASGTNNGGMNLSIPGVQGTVSLPGVKQLHGTANTNLGTFGQLMQAYPGGPFQAPTLDQARQTPGYQFALQQGENAMQAGAAANGSLLTGGTETALNNYAQGMADTNYNNIYNQALNTYGTNYNVWSNNQANMFNRLAAMSGMGQTAANQLGTFGLNSANQVANTLGETGRGISQQNSNAAAATASGYVGGANAWGGALNGMGGNLQQLLLMQQLMNGGNVNYGGGSPGNELTNG